jgi:hypothetical protein
VPTAVVKKSVLPVEWGLPVCNFQAYSRRPFIISSSQAVMAVMNDDLQAQMFSDEKERG